MSHAVEYVTDHSVSALTVRGRGTSGSNANQRRASSTVYARFTKLGGFNSPTGIRIKVRSVTDDTGLGPVDIRGEDLFALREFLAELPEEAFVRPADPVEAPPRWVDGDIVEEFYGTGKTRNRIWIRQGRRWRSTASEFAVADQTMEAGFRDDCGYQIVVVRQASQQDI